MPETPPAGTNGKEIVIHKEASSLTHYQCPILKSTNYTIWALRIKLILEANGLWETIEPSADTERDVKKDKATMAYLYQALPEDVILQIASCKTAKEVWEALKTRHVGVDRVQKARLQTLTTEFELLQMKEDETIDSFTGKMNSIVTKASCLGTTFGQPMLVRKLLNDVPDRFTQIVASIEQFTDLDEITLDETIGRLKTYEERLRLKKGGPADNQDKLLFTRHDNNSSRGNRFENRGQGRFNIQHITRELAKPTGDLSKVQCYGCNKFGHVKKNCPQQEHAQEQSNLVQEDVEPTLLMAVNEDKKIEEIFLNGRIEPSKYTTADESLWYLDNGASNHMTGVQEHFQELDENITGNVRFGDGSYVEIRGKGSIVFECKNKEQRVISQVYYIPSLKSNILSLGQLTENGCKVTMERDLLLLHDQEQKLLMRVTRSRNRLYNINLKIGVPICLLGSLEDQAWLWHARLGHLNFDSIRQMTQKNLVQGIPKINHASQICDACLLGKHSRAPFPKQAKFKSSEALDLVYGDLCGHISPPTHSGKKYIFLLVDDCTRYMWVYFLNSKDQAFETFKEFKQRVENEVGTKLKMLRTNRGGEFTSNEFSQYCKDNGIARQLTAPYSPQQNGVVERRNRTMLSTTRSMLKAMKMPQNFWGEEVRHAIYVLNRVPTKALKDSTPYEALKGRKPNLEYLRIFGCVAYSKVPSQHLKKLDDRSIPMVYLGIEEGSKACRLFDQETKRICVSRYVKFVEKDSWNWKEYIEEVGSEEPEWVDFAVANKDATNLPKDIEIEPINLDDDLAERSARPFDHTPLQGFRTLTEVTKRAREVEADYKELLLAEEEPRNYKEAAEDGKWIEAMKAELESINKNETWKLTDLPSNHKAIGLKWVFKTKRDASGKITKHKARLVAKGYVQRQGIDFEEVFAPVARIETVRLILAVAAYNEWEVHHLDVKSAFLHGDLMEEVYVSQPEGFVKTGSEGKVYKLSKALYGLRQAPRAWNMKLDHTLKSLGFEKCNLEQAVYTRRNKDSTLLIRVYVDDLIVTGTPKKEIEHFKCQMEEKFEMSDLGSISSILSRIVKVKTIEGFDLKVKIIERYGFLSRTTIPTRPDLDRLARLNPIWTAQRFLDRLGQNSTFTVRLAINRRLSAIFTTLGEISIKQTGYKNKILKDANMIDSNETKIPMDPGTKLTKTEGGDSVDETEYRSLIGCLRYLLHTRPDLCYSVRLLSRFMQEPKEHHLKAIKQVLRYIKGTKEFGITYKKLGGCKITGYSDSSYGVNTEEGKETTRIVFYFGNSPITWSTQKQQTVALSSCESEFMTATAAACQALWLKRLLSGITGWKEEKITLLVDNISAIALMKNPVFYGRSKHIDTRYHFIRECVEDNHINVEHISGELQRADILTKALARVKFTTMRELLGVQDLQQRDRD
ncbi:hypothetical protein L1987_17887 [Smallanthus sonchifolius]|uniref:Uncharacterized protein n=1 Tax=Smallanthus sonchifolius TaxID=185202 RepID=A0ACB9J0R4_9ASTR|nr:hypothetical protein L1987_17887 [Smallanthus sonchifolius]